ncbi:MAG: trypsin-like serine protease [bacterium]|nr:trypsin-like serine protease [bacterium]
MKKNMKYLTPFLLSVVLLFSNHLINCSGSNSPAGLFGDMKQSPLKPQSDSSEAGKLQDTFKQIFDLYKDSVVSITTEQLVRVRSHPFFDDPFMKDFFGRRRTKSRVQKRTGLGTGFIISEDGYICTNHHVINGVDKVKVAVNNRTYEAKVIGSDKKTDIALLKINAEKNLKPVYFGDSDKVNVGNWAIAIGNPFGLDKTFTVGVISAIGRKDVDLMGGSHIQTDASINPGNSGGPLINIYGEVVGINRMIYSKSGGYMGIGFAIPMNTANSILAQLKKYQKVKRGYIGINIIPLTEKYAGELGLDSSEGVIVGETIEGGPAARGGIKVGDVIIKVTGKKIKDHRDLLNRVSEAEIGKSLKMTVWRNRRSVNLYIKVAERP